MDKEQLKQKAEEIRSLVANNDIDDALEALKALTQELGGDHWDEALTLSANWNALEDDVRRGVIDSANSNLRRNQLIDQILELTRGLEREEGPVPATDPNREADKPVGKQPNFFVILVGLLAVSVGAVFFIINASSNTMTTCERLLDEGRLLFLAEKYVEAEEAFIAAKRTCGNDKEAVLWLQRIEDQTDPNIKSTERDSMRVRVLPLIDIRDVDQLIKKAKEAYRAKKYQEAYPLVEAALKNQPSEELKSIKRELQEKLYRMNFQNGTTFYQNGRYKEALQAFQKAQTYKDFSQVQGMIRKTKANLRSN